MNNLLKVCVYNTDPDSSSTLGEAVSSLNFVRIVAEVSTQEELALILQESSVNLIFYNLDPESAPILEVIEDVSARFPEVAQVATSSQVDPQSILAPIRAGCDQFICKPIDTADLGSAFSRVASKRLSVQHKSRVICITGACGGMGATSIASNLAMEIGSITGRYCALADFDLQFGTVASNFDVEPKYTLYDLAAAGADVDISVLESTICELPCHVALLARPDQIDQSDAITPECAYRVLELLMKSYENIVIDVPHVLNPLTNALMSHADTIFIVAQLAVPSIRNAKRYARALQCIGIPNDRIHFIANRSGGRGSGRVTLKDFQETVGQDLFANIPNDFQFVARSIDFGRPAAALDLNSPVRVAIRKLAERLVSEDEPGGSDKRSRGGLLKRLLAK